ncbi:hypothetical protein C8R45DRAFT_934349 [Mycena sanguinolenta]|nr:hypothetical protein C8R45DRAFT_934349 [Mycena sanguinolenta]
MRIDRLCRLPGYRDPRADCYSLYDLFRIPGSFLFRPGNSLWTFVASCTAFCISSIVSGLGFYSENVQAIWADDNYASPETIHMGLSFCSRFPEPDEPDAVSGGAPSIPVLLVQTWYYEFQTTPENPVQIFQPTLIPKSNSDGDDLEDNADESKEPESDSVDQSGPENGQVRAKFWGVPSRRVALILDVSDTPECLQGDRKPMSIDAYIKKQDAWTGPTGSKKTGLALVTILDEVSTPTPVKGLIATPKSRPTVVGRLEAQTCPAELLILIPVDENDLRAVVIPKAGVPHNHPAFVRNKTPFQFAQKYKKAAETTGVIGQTTLRIDKASSTRALLDGKLPQEIHPSMVNNRKRREIVRSVWAASFPDGTGMKGNLNPYNSQMARFSAQARRQAQSRMKAMEKANADGEIKRLQAEVDARDNFHLMDRRRRTDHLVITAPSPSLFFIGSPPNSPSPIARTRGSANYQALSRVNDSPIAGHSRLPELELISRPRKARVREPSSDFDYEAALKSDVLDATLHCIAYGIDVPMYPVGDPDDDILASDPCTPYRC